MRLEDLCKWKGEKKCKNKRKQVSPYCDKHSIKHRELIDKYFKKNDR